MAGMLLAKCIASAVSVGSGFRGGLFSASLLIGSLFGSVAASLAAFAIPDLAVSHLAYTLIGMSAVAAGVVGAPVTLILLVLEGTANFSLTVAVMIAVLAATLVVRKGFGYSFATWRFHLRGVPIRGGYDIGWIEDLTVGKLMRRDVQTVPATMPLETLRRRFAPGDAKRLFVLDVQGRFLGLLEPTDAHAPELDAEGARLTAADLLDATPGTITPEQNIRTALARFVEERIEALAVISPNDGRLLGFLTESYALRRYNQELERLRGEEYGDSGLFGPAGAN
jgi:CIC family chloride channel protein